MTGPRTAGGSPAVIVEGVNKTFRVPEERTHTLKERALHPFRRTRRTVFPALVEVNFEVQRGEFFGIVGRNGSGKSTLLKCMAGIYRCDRGSIVIDGRLSTFIELGVGFNADLAARDNIVLNGIMLGLTAREARARCDSVIEFAELEEFQDLKLKNYSSGMHVRLAFSVAIQVDADILLIDEVLAVGDASFQQKCFDVFNEMRDAGRTIVFVTHDMGAVNRFCHRAMLLERGEMVELGEPNAVAERYLELNFERNQEPSEAEPSPLAQALHAQRHSDRAGDGAARVASAWLEDPNGKPQNSVHQGNELALKCLVHFERDVEDPAVSLTIEDDERRAVVVVTTMNEHERTGRYGPGMEAVFAFWFLNVLAPGRYHATITVAHRGTGLDLIDRFARGFSFVVTGVRATGGMVDVPFHTSFELVHGAPARADEPQVSA
ncbi:MAG TPA: ABC transporter ATP-binding protein [Solirubrobacteraceae bacterium]|jgi:ABC-type polysaccharide/polyol phosphate transport system ATPase subunit|nr:ABC transporter ATP-binding protein [Solirubrobacteraceae bacterium]